jgi:hypothetical protein
MNENKDNGSCVTVLFFYLIVMFLTPAVIKAVEYSLQVWSSEFSRIF